MAEYRTQNKINLNDLKYFPKISKLIQLKDETLTDCFSYSLPLSEFPSGLSSQFEVVLVDPPWYEYYARCGGFREDLAPWTFEQIQALPVETVSAIPGFCFLWCGNKHIEQGIACLRKWGYRRIEDICWVKTNRSGKPRVPYLPHGSQNLFHNTKEHCVVGIKGNVTRSVDGHLIHANIDSDVIVAEEPEEFGSRDKPEEIYKIIERFCNSRRRLELFATKPRKGWVCVGENLKGATHFDPEEFGRLTGDRFIPTNQDIERLRPKSPVNRRSVPISPEIMRSAGIDSPTS
jgi:N6-adenosine-specific RNA methylase IME4